MGTYGLFDCDEEYDRRQAEIAYDERRRRRYEALEEESRARRQRRKELKAAKRLAAGKSELGWPASWLAKLFGGRRDVSPDAMPARPAVVQETENGLSGETRRSTPEPEPETEFEEDEVSDFDSPWLDECGLVMVRTGVRGRYRMVPKSLIRKRAEAEPLPHSSVFSE
ncbi:hypothetical protein ACN47E_008818 [Coniothyrium glycines]